MTAHLYPSRNDAQDYSSQDHILFTAISIYSILFKMADYVSIKHVNPEGVFVNQMHQTLQIDQDC